LVCEEFVGHVRVEKYNREQNIFAVFDYL